MKTYIADHPQGKHGRNAYDLDMYQITKEEIQSEFASYISTRLNK